MRRESNAIMPKRRYARSRVTECPSRSTGRKSFPSAGWNHPLQRGNGRLRRRRRRWKAVSRVSETSNAQIEGPHWREDPVARTEAVLMIAREPLPTRKLAQLAGLEDGTRARTLIRKLNQRYDSEGRAFRVVEVGGGFLTMTRPQFAPLVAAVARNPTGD